MGGSYSKQGLVGLYRKRRGFLYDSNSLMNNCFYKVNLLALPDDAACPNVGQCRELF